MPNKKVVWRKGVAEDTFWLFRQNGVLCRRCNRLLRRGDTVYYMPDENPYGPPFYVLCPSCFGKTYGSLSKAGRYRGR